MGATAAGIQGVMAVVLAVGLAACGGDDERQEGGCTPGSLAVCYCTGGAVGSHTCDQAGHSYSDCDCRPVEADVSLDTDAAAPEAVPPDAGPDLAEIGAPDVPVDVPVDVPAEPAPETSETTTDLPEAVDPDVCTPDCQGKDCGPDGCGGSCGTCEGEGVCVGGSCLCVPACEGKVCGADGCGGSCGTCEAGFLCSAAQLCEKDCTPVPVSPCQVLFSAPVTSPVPQEYVGVTGSFTSWAESRDAGAVPLVLDGVAGEWRGLVAVPAGPFEFKYLVKWADSAQQWCVVSDAGAFDCATGAANQSGTSTCGVTNPCVIP